MTDHRGATTIDPDRLVLAEVLGGGLRNRRITVLGFARSGIAVARFLADAGARVTVYDGRPTAQLRAAIAALEGRHVTLRLGPDVDPVATWRHAALVVASPSINPDYPTTEPRLRQALAALRDARAGGDPEAPAIVSEPDLFLRLCPAPTIGVTGTKGKTTTAALTAALLAGIPAHPAVLGGNIGIPLVERLPELTAEHRVVIELSELQLPTLSRGTTVAAYTNVTADHLDRHGTVEAYRRAKRRLAELVDPDGALVLNAEDPVVAAYAGLGTAPAVLYRRERPIPGGVGVVDGWIVGAGVQRLPLVGGGAAAVGPGGRILPLDELAIPGAHNVSNALAAVSVALLLGVAPDAIRRAAAGFTGVEHRLETVAVAGGIRYVNDSQGTQPDAVIAALRAFPAPVVLIAGGRDKGVDLSGLAVVAAERAAAAVLIGESADAMAGLFGAAGLARIERAASLDEAVATASAIARDALAAGGAAGAAGDPGRAASGPTGPFATVLLSPAAASFDMFVDYAARGRAFRAAVQRLLAGVAR
ncbi:MAG: UDP-N-acetylmuramoyl-L-alanine--D-glutamate ligase [Chloroflexota bacterium]|nr:MAG: UDP-N-acetylmuramoyl-L-alanine--D-glutamate ligase [Chloroflexota bacterium]